MHFPRVLAAVAAMSLAAGAWSAPAHKAAPATKAPAGPVQLELSHGLPEDRAERVQVLVDSFNKLHPDVHVTLVRRVEGQPPKELNLVTRAEYARLNVGTAKFTPLSLVMREAREPLDTAQFSPEMRDSLTDAKGQLLALPLAYSTPVLFINKETFRKAGLDPENPPKTWAEMQVTAGKLQDAGSRCPYTTSDPAWIFIDNLSAWNGGEVADAKGKLTFNGLLQVKHIAMMSTWYKSKYFIYFGQREEADRRFMSGECAMLTSSSSLFAALSDIKKIDVGVSPLPYHDDVPGAPKNTLADGASLWIGAGLKPAEIKGVAKFVKYVLGPEVQINLTLAGGFLPMTPVARAAAESKLLKADLAGLDAAFAELKGRTAATPLRVAQIEPVRQIVEEELEAVWANRKPAKEALDMAVQRGNALHETTLVAKAKSARK